jgi:hypothetical protein
MMSSESASNPAAGAPKAARDVEAALAREAGVEEHDVVRLGRERLFGRRAVLHPVDGVPGAAQATLHSGAEHPVVFDEEESHPRAPRAHDRLNREPPRGALRNVATRRMGAGPIPDAVPGAPLRLP